ncbi:ATP-dependent DNA ligase [Ramaria rubella]|nr:ATP-dependent DNA ligase [Ramaria rubella]
MAPKRTATPANPSTPPKNKKAKMSTGQTTLHSFFASKAAKGAEGSNNHGSPSSATSSSAAEIQDRELAQQLAQEDGIDLETMKRLEASWSRPHSDRAGNQKNVIEVELEEDALDDTEHFRTVKWTKDSCHNQGSKPNRQTKFIPGRASPRPINVKSQLPVLTNYPDLSQDPLIFETDCNPWPPSTPTPYSFLVHALSTLSQTRSRISILNTLTNYFRLISLYHPQTLAPSLYLLSNSISPPYLPVELGLGPSIISKSLQQVSGLTPGALSKLYKSLGDPGDVAFSAKSSVQTLIPHQALSVLGVYNSLLKIARARGQGAAKIKQAIVEKLLLSAKGEECRYLVRTLCQNLRVGAVRNTIISALARAMVFLTPAGPSPGQSIMYASPELLQHVQPTIAQIKKNNSCDPVRHEILQMFTNAEALVKRCFVRHPNLDDIAAALLDVGLGGLADRVPLAVGIPLHPTLGSPTRSLDEVYERLDGLPFAAEFKYDGQRAQLHASQGNDGGLIIKIFSRHLEDMTDKYPDVIALTELIFASHSDLSSFIMDAEIVAVDARSGEMKSFQDLSQRARKDVRIEDIKVAVSMFVYDLMYLNGVVLLERPFRERRGLLRDFFPPITPEKLTIARFAHVQSCDSEEGRAAVEEFWQRAIMGRAEGLMIKLLEHGEVNENDAISHNARTQGKPLPASYEPDKRTSAWLKLKKDYVTGLGDSLDLVPIGAWHGNGRKANWWSPVLLSLWDDTRGEYVAVCKCMSGFSDAFYKEMRERYAEDSDTCSSTSLWNCNAGGFKPSVYFKPSEVWEVRGADVTSSPVSTAAFGLVPGNRGLSLRFPRFIKIREDKGLKEASTPGFLADMWQMQEAEGKDARGVDEGELVDGDWESAASNEDGENHAFED